MIFDYLFTLCLDLFKDFLIKEAEDYDLEKELKKYICQECKLCKGELFGRNTKFTSRMVEFF